jgi:hypothetical protein
MERFGIAGRYFMPPSSGNIESLATIQNTLPKRIAIGFHSHTALLSVYGKTHGWTIDLPMLESHYLND